jgi:hypothetical protein
MITLRNETTGATSEHTSVAAAKLQARNISHAAGNTEETSYWMVTDHDGTRYRGSRNASQQRNPGGRAAKGIKRIEWTRMMTKDPTRVIGKSVHGYAYKDEAGGQKHAGPWGAKKG